MIFNNFDNRVKSTQKAIKQNHLGKIIKNVFLFL